MTEPLNIATSATESLTLYDLQRLVRTTLEGRFGDALWISAEISELKVNRSGHCYLNLVEKGEGGGTPRAEARAVMWRSAYERLSREFSELTGTTLSAGMRILARVVVSYHEVYGFSLQIIDIDARYTLGEVERRRRETIARLMADGVWDMNRELELARPTLRIAVVSSATAAGYQDFCRELDRAPYRFHLTLFESLMQGDAAERSVVEAMYAIAAREEDFDAVVIIRGGGSTSDLSLFDSYLIASHIAQFPLPIFTGIGHDKDTSVADMVAHTSCKTPTAVATTLAEMADREWATIDDYARELHTGVMAELANEKRLVERYMADVERMTMLNITNSSHRIDRLEESIFGEVRRRLIAERQRLDMADTFAQSRAPERLLSLGYALVRSAEGVVRTVDTISLGDSLTVELADGTIETKVVAKQRK